MAAKKAQGWGFDLIIALTLFMGGVLVFYLLSLNSYDETNDIIKSLSYESRIVSDSLLSPGYPEDWTSSSVTRIGIMTNSKINETKLEQFYQMSKTNYQLTKVLLNTNNEYYFFFSEPMIINGSQVNGIGMTNNSQSNLIKITRYTIYQDKPVTVNLYIWN
jgi:hypothetical protein